MGKTLTKKSRIDAVIKNSGMTIFVQIATLMLNFVQRTFLIRILGEEYAGIDGLFSNILTILSLAELGVGSAIVFSMYKPMAERDEQKLVQLIQFYGKVFRLVGSTIIIAGTALTPFLGFFIKDPPNISNISLIYVLYVINTGISYFFSYKASILTVGQEDYIVSLNRFIFHSIQIIFQVFILIRFRDFIIFFLIKIICTLLSNISVTLIANKKYPFILSKSTSRLSESELNKIKKNVAALFLHKVGTIVIYGTDNLLISRFISIAAVGIYSNYSMIISAVSTFTSSVFYSMTASVGNLGAEGDQKHTYQIFKNVLFLNYFIGAFCTVCLLFLLNPFIKLWLGERFLLSDEIVLLIVIVFYIDFGRRAVIVFRNALGLFWYDRYKPFVEASVNLISSIALAQYFGMAGVFGGTVISFLGVSFWWESLILYKYGFKKKFRLHVRDIAKYTAATLLCIVIGKVLDYFIGEFTLIRFCIRMMAFPLLAISVFYLLFHKSEEFLYIKDVLKRKLLKRF